MELPGDILVDLELNSALALLLLLFDGFLGFTLALALLLLFGVTDGDVKRLIAARAAYDRWRLLDIRGG